MVMPDEFTHPWLWGYGQGDIFSGLMTPAGHVLDGSGACRAAGRKRDEKSMNWITIIMSMSSAMRLTLGSMHLMIWSRRRDQWPHLLFALTIYSIAAS